MIDPESAATADAAGLRYVTDGAPGIARVRQGRGFRYVAPDGSAVRDPRVLARIRSLRIPPAWTNVWIASDPRGHIQAVGRDARGRKQHRYHPRWVTVRDEAKYGRMVEFARALPLVRAHTDRDLRRPGLPREKVLACVVRLLEGTLIRVGNREYAKHNRHFGLTTMRDSHVELDGSCIAFRFVGKGGKVRSAGICDVRLARVVARCSELPGHSTSTTKGSDTRSTRRTSTSTCARSRAATSPRRTFGRGPAPCSRCSRCASSTRSDPRRRRRRTSSR